MRGNFFIWTRLFFPTWRFFDVFEKETVLEYRVRGAGEAGEWSDWRNAHPKAEWTWVNFFYNPQAVVAHLLNSQVDRFLQNGFQGGEYLNHWVSGMASEQGASAGFQWRLVTSSGSADQGKKEVYVSSELSGTGA